MVAEATVRPGLPAERVFYLSMVGALWAGVVLGFSRSFILRPLFPNAHGAPEPYFYAHGFLFLGWLALLATQAGLVSAGNLRLHRRLGVAGVVMVPLMTVVATVGGLIAARRPGGFIDIPAPPLEFLIVPITNIVAFVGLAGAALLLRGSPQTHKRLMLLATIAIAEAAVARWPVEAIATNPQIGFWVTCLYIVPLAVWDLTSRRRLHWATLIGGAVVIAQGPARDFATTPAWHAFATWATGLLG